MWLAGLALLPMRQVAALPVARLKNVRPLVQLAMNKGPFVAARERDKLSFGSTVRTNATGKAGVWFANGAKVLVAGPRASLSIVEPPTATRPLLIRVTGALTRILVRPKDTLVVTAAGTAAAPGTEYLLEMPTEDSTIITVIEGSVDFFNPQGRVVLHANQQSKARVGQAPSPPVTVDVTGLTAWTADISGLPVEFETPFVAVNLNTARALQGRRLQEVRANPNSAAARQALGEAHYDAGAYDEAGAAFAAATRLAPQSAAAFLGLGRAKQAQGDVPAAAAAYEQARQLAPDDFAPRIGAALTILARPAQARDDEAGQDEARRDRAAARALLQTMPQSALAQAVLGLLELHEGNAALATQHLEAAIARDARLYQAHSLLALALLTQNQIPQAAQAARQATLLRPASAQAQGTLATVLFFQNRVGEATRAAARAVAANPLSPFALLAQGRVLLAQMRTDEARDALQQAQALAPGLPLIQADLGAVYLRLDRLPQAERALRRALQLAPNSAGAHTALGVALQRQGRTQEALAEHQQALRLDAANTSARVNLATLLIEEGRLDEAQTQLQQGIGAQPERGLLWVRMSEVSLLRRQNLHQAEQFARRGVQILPDSALAHYQLGRIYLEQGRLVQAEQEFRQATILDRQFADSRFALGFTRALTEPRQNLLPAPGSSDLGSVARVISLLNLQSPGNEERIQAGIQDPTVFRVASRAYGDTQFDTLTGGLNTRNYRLSHLRESADRRGEMGLIAEREGSDGVRLNADETTDRLSAVAGNKAAGGPSGWFALGQVAQQRKGLNGQDVGGFSAFETRIINGQTERVPLGVTARRRTQTPLLLLGFNSTPGERRRTRALLQYSTPSSHIEGLQNSSRMDQDLSNFSFEMRHDVQLNPANLLSAGFSTGTSRLSQNFLFLPANPQDLTFRSFFDIKTRTIQAYLRDEWQAAARLTLLAEVQYQRAGADGALSVRSEAGTGFVRSRLQKDALLPALLATYRPDKRSGLRFRARRLFGTVSEFQLLAPTDVFLSSTNNLPDLSLTGSGSSYELEYDRTFRDASFLRVGVFDRRLNNARDALLRPIARAQLRGVRAGYSGVLNRSTTFFANLDLNSAKNANINRYIDNVPRLSAATGVQYLSSAGWFVQPSLLFQGSRLSTSAKSARLASFGLWNLRIGKRWGLRSILSVEVTNLFDKKYALFFPDLVQPGRQLRLGLTQRF